MKKPSFFLAAALALPVCATPVIADAQVANAPAAPATAPALPAAQEIAFGNHPLQSIDLYKTSQPGQRPLILFVHGGAWVGGDKSDSTGQAKIRHYTDAGYQLASVNYRLLPEVEIEQQAADVAASLAQLVDRARDLDIDSRRIILMGHSAGAHLAALVATDPQYLQPYGLKPDDIGGVVLLDGAAYDVPSQIVDAGPLVGFAYQVAFGTGAQRQQMLSPASHARTDNARSFLMLHVQRAEAQRQAYRLAEALKSGGTPAQVAGVAGQGMEGHNRINGMLGRSDSDATPIVDAWLAGLFTPGGIRSSD